MSLNRINELFKIKKNNLICLYFCAGSPLIDNTVDVIKTLEKKGINMIEIGIPYIDPKLDGETIQIAHTKALKNGMTLDILFTQLNNIRKEVNIPLIIMSYLYPINQYGFENFCKKCNEIGIDGLILPDLPFDDYLKTYKQIVDKFNIRLINLIFSNMDDETIHYIDFNSDGFIYVVASGKTGQQSKYDENQINYFKHIKEIKLINPTMIGFGINNKQTLKTAFNYSNGAIIGSKFVKLLDSENGNTDEAIDKLFKMLKN